MRPIERFWKLLKPDSKEIRTVYVYAIFSGILSLSLPLGIQSILNLIQGGRVSTSWIVLVILVIVGFGLSGLLQVYQLKITEKIQQNIFTRAAFEFAYRIPRIKMEKLYKHYAPELMNRFFDIITIQKSLSKILIEFSTAALHTLFGLILLSFYHPFFIIFSLLLIVLVLVIFKLTGKSGLDTSLNESEYKYRVVHWLEEVARTSATFKLAGNPILPLKRTDDLVDEYLTSRQSHFNILLRQYYLLLFFKVLVITGLLAVGGFLVMEQSMNIGQFVAAEIIIILVINSVEKLILSLETIYDILTGLAKIGQVTDLELESHSGICFEENGETPGLKLELKDLSFTYPNFGKPSIRNISLDVHSNESIVITGESSAGKSTLLHLIAGLYQDFKGSISYNSLPLGNYESSSLRSVIGGVLSYEQIFEGSIQENISMGRVKATIENVRWAIENVGLGDFVKSQKQGLDTKLESLGKGLSKSIIQKILIARSFVDKPKLLLYEYTFEHIKEKERNDIIDFLLDKNHSWTIVAVTADPYFISKSDRNIQLAKGEILTK